MIFFTSDTHFGDPRVLRIDRRPFRSMEEHDEALIGLWNETVGKEDDVWHLGDFMRLGSGGRADALLHRLNGRKHLEPDGQEIGEPARPLAWPADAGHPAIRRRGGSPRLAAGHAHRTSAEQAKKDRDGRHKLLSAFAQPSNPAIRSG